MGVVAKDGGSAPMWGAEALCQVGLVTDRAARLDAQPAVMPRWWWARGLNLRERLDAPRPPAGGAAGGGGRTGAWGPGVRAGFAARLAALALSDGLASALGEELPERLGARAAEPHWARFVEAAVAAAPERLQPVADRTGSR